MGSSRVLGLTAMILVVMMMMILNTSATTDKKNCTSMQSVWAKPGHAGATVDWLLTSTAYTLIMDVPGVENLDIEVKVADFEIWCQGERMRPTEDDTDIYFHGRNHGMLWHRFCFPEDAIMAHVKAQLDNGVLSLTIPRNQSVSASIPARPPKPHFEGLTWPDY